MRQFAKLQFVHRHYFGLDLAVAVVTKRCSYIAEAKMTAADIRLTLCVLALDVAATLVEFVKTNIGLFDETIVVDIGSTDQTIKLATNLGARVYARGTSTDLADDLNLGLAHATGDWVLLLEADERIDRINAETLRSVLAEMPRHVSGLAVTRPLYPDTHESRRIPLQQTRLIRNRDDIVFEGPIFPEVNRCIRNAGDHLGSAPIGLSSLRPESSFFESAAGRRLRSILARLHCDYEDSSPERLCKLGAAHFFLGNLFHAECYLDDFLREVGTSHAFGATAAVQLIECYLLRGDLVRAKQACNKLTTLFPENLQLLKLARETNGHGTTASAAST